jgi:hypothetical protein
VGGKYGMRGREKEIAKGFGRKARRKGTTRNTEKYMRDWNQNESQENWLGGCGVDLPRSGQKHTGTEKKFRIFRLL